MRRFICPHVESPTIFHVFWLNLLLKPPHTGICWNNLKCMNIVTNICILYMALESNFQIFRFSYRVNNTKILRSSTVLFWQIYVAGSNKTYLSLHVECPIFLLDFNQIFIFSTDFHRSFQYQVSRKFVEWEPRWYMMTEYDTKVQTTKIMTGSRKE
jgi:hypothetical protein